MKLNCDHVYIIDTYPDTDIADVEAEVSNNGSICIMCTFTPGSNVQGCTAVLYLNDGTMQPAVYNISKQGDSETLARKCIHMLAEGNYTVNIYDWGGYGNEMSEDPVYELHISLTLSGKPTPGKLYRIC